MKLNRNIAYNRLQTHVGAMGSSPWAYADDVPQSLMAQPELMSICCYQCTMGYGAGKYAAEACEQRPRKSCVSCAQSGLRCEPSNDKVCL